MVTEADMITSLRHETKRAIIFVNSKMDYGMFLINQANAQRTLVCRIADVRYMDLEQLLKSKSSSNKFIFVDVTDSQDI